MSGSCAGARGRRGCGSEARRWPGLTADRRRSRLPVAARWVMDRAAWRRWLGFWGGKDKCGRGGLYRRSFMGEGQNIAPESDRNPRRFSRGAACSSRSLAGMTSGAQASVTAGEKEENGSGEKGERAVGQKLA
jgi:hypothetical protein